MLDATSQRIMWWRVQASEGISDSDCRECSQRFVLYTAHFSALLLIILRPELAPGSAAHDQSTEEVRSFVKGLSRYLIIHSTRYEGLFVKGRSGPVSEEVVHYSEVCFTGTPFFTDECTDSFEGVMRNQ